VGHLQRTLSAKKTSKSSSCFAFFGGDVGQKPGFQKTNQIENILGLIHQEELLRVVWYLGLLYSFSRWQSQRLGLGIG
jgi:hypothetical protein